MLKRLALLFSLVAALGIGGGAIASTADAARCTASTSNVWWDGQLEFQAALTSCSGVNAVQFSGADIITAGYNGIWDASIGVFHTSTTSSGTIVGTFPSYVFNYGTTAWCGGATHTTSNYFRYRIRNSVGSTWGNWTNYGGINYEQIKC